MISESLEVESRKDSLIRVNESGLNEIRDQTPLMSSNRTILSDCSFDQLNQNYSALNMTAQPRLITAANTDFDDEE